MCLFFIIWFLFLPCRCIYFILLRILSNLLATFAILTRLIFCIGEPVGPTHRILVVIFFLFWDTQLLIYSFNPIIIIKLIKRSPLLQIIRMVSFLWHHIITWFDLRLLRIWHNRSVCFATSWRDVVTSWSESINFASSYGGQGGLIGFLNCLPSLTSLTPSTSTTDCCVWFIFFLHNE